MTVHKFGPKSTRGKPGEMFAKPLNMNDYIRIFRSCHGRSDFVFEAKYECICPLVRRILEIRICTNGI